ncbi:HAMP domain-containing methyl-accepting chemotaxis protein [Psychrobacillus sp. MER TA 171]|uniref:methyl-accepting chemotaxis protein n=1 Tax=Psychrobacillus sp. MER TA 171 TaxID=2939577 RepID=UPI00203A64A9|nr:HAMP domain-containing methyl-accepting chemotaxis protein [Psychrobacillus sp. MER TA 171]MCM3356436.1 methyl-accepting chemotaxis protein [Psychrobacillus sp. MER TA 171]
MKEKRKKHAFGFQKKIVLFVTVLAIITYSTSALFINYVQPYLQTMDINIGALPFEILTYALGIFWSGLLAYFFSGLIIKPLFNLEKVATLASEGKIGVDVEVPNSKDEIQSVAIAFQTMLENLREMVQGIEENFDKTNNSVQKLAEEASVASDQAEAIASTIAQISEGAEQSAMAVQETAESVEDVRVLASEVNKRAEKSSVQSKEMITELSETTKVIQSLVSGIQKIASGSESALGNVHQLEENASKVESIIQLVGDIAAQTNLLALNASIEAARAGEHGKGFAVVAEEVRKLADESAKAVQGISTLILAIQSDVQTVVQQMTNQVSFAVGEAKRVSETNAAVEGMSTKVHEMAESVVEISSLVEKQLSNIESTARQSQDVAAIAEETSAGAEEVRSATDEQARSIEQVDILTEDLKRQSEDLFQVISQFDRTAQ